MKPNKTIVATLAIIGALMFVSAAGIAMQSYDCSAADDEAAEDETVTFEVKFKQTTDIIWVLDGEDVTNFAPGAHTFEEGTKIKVSVKADTGFEGTPIIVAGGEAYQVGTDYEIKGDVEFTVRSGFLVKFTTTPGIAWYFDDELTINNFIAEKGSKHKIDARLQTGYEGTVVIKANSSDYTANADYTIPTAETTFTATGAELKTYAVSFTETPGITWKCDGIEVTAPIPVKHGNSIKVVAEVDEGYEGTPEIKIGDTAYTANSSHTVTSEVTFSATGVTEVSNGGGDSGGGNTLMYAAIVIVVLLAVCFVAWFFFFKNKP